jgi:lysophospholipase L1-like esterase
VTPRRWAARLLLSTGSLALLLLLAELSLRLADPASAPSAFRMARLTDALEQDLPGRFGSDATRAFTTAAHFRFSVAHAGRDATGEWPFRGRPASPLPPAAALPRVLVVGDSCVYGASLDPCDTFGWRLAQALDARGLPPDRVAVIPLGVPGYSTEQILPLLRWGLAQCQPVAVVLYPAAWNDQAPALRAPDRQVLAELTEPSPLTWLRDHTRLGAGLLSPHGGPAHVEILAGWRAGHPPLGWRVPAADVEPNVRAMLQACTSAGATPIVLAPAHPDGTLADHPRTADDAAAVLRAATAAGATAVDAQAVLRGAGGSFARFFCDYIHPSPEAVRLLVDAIAEPVARAVQAAPATSAGTSASAPSILSVEPTEAFALGDVKVRLKLGALGRIGPLPAVLVGGAPLLDVRELGEDTLEGTLTANGAGPQDILLQDEQGCALLRSALRLREPTITIEPGEPPHLVVQMRPDDRVALMVSSTLRDAAEWSARGAFRLGADAHALPQELVADRDGAARLQLPALPSTRLYVQALWAPAAESPDHSLAARWTGVVELGG